MPAVSVIMPVYNKEKYVEASIRSLQAQTLNDFELIIINDGSTDDSLNVIRAREVTDARIRVLNMENAGVSHARNCGLSVATGQYITFVDSDDLVHPEYLQNMYDYITGQNADMVISGVEKYWTDRPERVAVQAPMEGIRTKKDILPEFAEVQKKSGIYGICVAKMFSRAMAADIAFDEQLTLGEDFDFYLQLYSKMEKIYFDRKCLYYYLQEADNSSVKVSDEKIDYYAQFRISLRYRQFLQNHNSYASTNREIVDRKLSNYLFLALHYCPKRIFRERFDCLRMLCAEHQLSYTGVSVWQNAVLDAFRRNSYVTASVLIQGYHFLRKCVGGRS